MSPNDFRDVLAFPLAGSEIIVPRKYLNTYKMDLYTTSYRHSCSPED